MFDRFSILFLILVVQGALVSSALAQDERFFRQLFAGEEQKKNKVNSEKVYHYKVQSPFYMFDINKNHRKEKFLIEEKDGETWLYIHDYQGKKIFSHRFQATGYGSSIYKISIRNLSPKTRIFIIHFFEGKTKHVDYHSTGRFYFLTMDNLDLNTLSMFKGPIMWEEYRNVKDHYHQRKYELSLYDFNNDGVKEVLVKYNLSSKVFLYKDNGKWLRN